MTRVTGCCKPPLLGLYLSRGLPHYPSTSSAIALAPLLTFALVIEGAAHGHREKAEGIQPSPKEEGCEDP